MTDAPREPIRYRDAGVDIDRGDALVEAIKPIAARTRRPGWHSGLGGFGALFELPVDRYREPVLVSGTDGVGTKLRLAFASGRHDGVGIDLVAMCANDIVVQGAEPLFFLDYFATGRIDPEVARVVIAGIGRGCELAGAALIGGETAEMPDMYAEGEYDLAGFCVGVAEKARLIDGSTTRAGDVLLGLASSGAHSNGFSLVRRILERTATPLDHPLGDARLVDLLMEPTRIYVRSLLALFDAVPVRGAAHITGGGLIGNVPRVLPAGLVAAIDTASWSPHKLFTWLQEAGPVARDEMFRTFNCGVGMVVIVPEDATEDALAVLREHGETAWQIGRVENADGPGGVRLD